MKTRYTLFALWAVMTGLGAAQGIVLKDGRFLAATKVSRKADGVIAQAVPSGEVAVPVDQIARIEFPLPSELAQAADLIVEGKVDEAIALIEPVVNAQMDFRDLPGNRWAEAALGLAQALDRQGRGLEAQALVDKVSAVVAGNDLEKAAAVQSAFVLCSRGDHVRPLALVEPVLRESRLPGARAGAFVVKGQCLLAEEKWEEALLCFLQIPVFYPDEKVMMPVAQLGRGRSHLGMDDFGAARAALEDLRKTYPNSAEAKLAAKELERVNLREKGLSNTR